MKQIICDRCGEIIDYTQGIPVFVITRTNTGMYMDMCRKCREQLIKFMHNVPLDFNSKEITDEKGGAKRDD